MGQIFIQGFGNTTPTNGQHNSTFGTHFLQHQPFSGMDTLFALKRKPKISPFIWGRKNNSGGKTFFTRSFQQEKFPFLQVFQQSNLWKTGNGNITLHHKSPPKRPHFSSNFTTESVSSQKFTLGILLRRDTPQFIKQRRHLGSFKPTLAYKYQLAAHHSLGESAP